MQVLYLNVRHAELPKEKNGVEAITMTARMNSADGIVQPASPKGQNEKEIENQQWVNNN